MIFLHLWNKEQGNLTWYLIYYIWINIFLNSSIMSWANIASTYIKNKCEDSLFWYKPDGNKLVMSSDNTWEITIIALQWLHSERNGVPNHQPHDIIVYSTVYSGADKENIKAPCHCPLWEEFIGDQWIPHTKGQWRGKCFHFMTSSCQKLATNKYHTNEN